MSKGVHESKRPRIIDLRRQRAGASASARTMRFELPAYRRTSLRARRRKLRALLALVVLVAMAGAVYGVSKLSYLPRYSIKEVKVEGTGSVPSRLVRAFVERQLNDGTYPIISRENIFLYPKAEIAKSTANYFPRILSATISRQSLLAQAITVTVVERKPLALWCQEIGNGHKAEGAREGATGNTCFEMDNGGFIFAKAVITTSGGIVFTGGLATSTAPIGQTFLTEYFESVLTLLAHLQEQGFPVASVSVESEQDFSISLSRGFVLRASFGADAATLVRNLQTVLSSDSLRGKENTIEYIDLRFGNRVYYKFRK